eukprot:gb/GFBE01023799.1/.p1 GENE.gb/GFBE01023799.1/~~gb/GFBE01023799.1/.p1  ORF type:complete len:203 (+),score=56.65 gb/GFBE01023799.1/:1-609(+)
MAPHCFERKPGASHVDDAVSKIFKIFGDGSVDQEDLALHLEVGVVLEELLMRQALVFEKLHQEQLHRNKDQLAKAREAWKRRSDMLSGLLHQANTKRDEAEKDLEACRARLKHSEEAMRTLQATRAAPAADAGEDATAAEAALVAEASEAPSASPCERRELAARPASEEAEGPRTTSDRCGNHVSCCVANECWTDVTNSPTS